MYRTFLHMSSKNFSLWEWHTALLAVGFISFRFSYISMLFLSNFLIHNFYFLSCGYLFVIYSLSAFFSRGYTAPEYAIRGELCEKADIYSFGVLVLEIISCRKNTDLSLSLEMQYLPEYVSHLSSDKIYLCIRLLLIFIHSLCCVKPPDTPRSLDC